MARGVENKEVVDRFFRELENNLDFLNRFTCTIIPQKEEDAEVLRKGLKAIETLRKFNQSCRGDFSLLSELYDIDGIVEKYPDIEKILRDYRDSSHHIVEDILEEHYE